MVKNKLKEAYKYQNAGAQGKAIRCFRQLAEQDVGHKNLALLEIGKCHKMDNRPGKSIDFFKKVLSTDPSNTEALKELIETSRLDGQIEALQEFLEGMEEKNRKVYLELASIYRGKRQFKKAVESLEYADPKRQDHDCMIERARIKSLQGSEREATAIFKDILQQQPQYSSALTGLAGVHLKKGEIRPAAQLYKRAADIEKTNKHLYLKFIELSGQADEIEGAEEAASRLLELTPDNPFHRDIMLNEVEILQRKTNLKSQVKRLWVTVTSRCNIRCKTCGLWQKKWDLPLKTAREVMALYPTLERVVWLGGEVFLYKYFEEMFDRAAEFSNLQQQVITNGVILTDHWIEKLVGTPNTELTFSVDGSSKKVYESIRKGADFDKLRRKIRKTVKLKNRIGSACDIRFNMLVMKSNYHQMQEVMDMAKSEGINQITYLAVHLENAPEENIFENNCDKRIVGRIAEEIPGLRSKAQEYGMEIDILLPPGKIMLDDAVAESESKQDPDAEPVKKVYCTMPWKYMMICDDGNVIPTGSCIKSIGNINDSSLKSIWNSPAAQTYRRRMIENSYETFCRPECFFRMGLG